MAGFRLSAGYRYAAAGLSGAALPLSLAPLSWWPVAILCCASLFSLTRRLNNKQLFFTNLIFGIGLYATGASWIYVSIHQYGQAPALLAGLMTGAFA
ncbi:MAG TPA: apolipoprotein N-acyltransferase, partial [Porticoccaceae bacterium]|nr:apolipoprotein N-acyltransferase [Porticoccaceae bacterium]